MNNLRLLIADDSDENRLVLRTICKKLEGFEIKDAVDGLEAVDMVESWKPHIILMDIMMPNMDGFEASRIIKEKYPEIVIIAVTAIIDSHMQDNMNAIGVDIYIQKPVDIELVRYKLESIGSALRSKISKMKAPSKKIALNPFNSDIRSFKTFFEITDIEAMMDFGMWLFDQFNGKSTIATKKFNSVLDIFYKLMSQGHKNSHIVNITIEESYEEFYITMNFESAIHLEEKMLEMLNSFATEYLMKENIIYVKLAKPNEPHRQEIEEAIEKEVEKVSAIEIKEEETFKNIEEEQKQVSMKEVRVIDSRERELLHQSFVSKTSAEDYVNETGGDVLDEILDLSSIDEEWTIKLSVIEETSSEESLINFADSVLSVYVQAINNLFEFTALAYALSSLAVFIKSSANEVSQDKAKVKTLVMLLEHLGTDLTSWREHIFVLQDTADIHYLDSSFFSSCMQIEAIIHNKHVDADDDNDMEFF